MSATSRLSTVLAVLVLAAGLALPAAAALSSEDEAAIRNYTLTVDYLESVEALTEDAQARGIKANLDAEDFRQSKNLDELAEKFDTQAGVHDLLAEHDLTAREYLLGAFALMGASMVVKYGDDPQQGKHIDKSKVNPANVAFYRKHQDKIEALMAAGRKQGAQ